MTRIISIVGGMQPTAPTIGTATGGDTSASVAFTASSYIGKGTITYTATSSPGGLTGTGTSPITVSGLTTGTAYTFTVVGTTNYGVASVASAASNSITPAAQSSYESIATISVGSGGASSISFTSIPSTFTHLQIRGIARSGRASTQDEYKINYNSDTGNNYSRHSVVGYGSGVEATGFVSQSHWRAGWFAGNNLTANGFGAAVFDILDYTNTNKYKTGRGFTSYDGNGNGNSGFVSGVWLSTSAITQIDITPAFSSFLQYSSFALYGIKGV